MDYTLGLEQGTIPLSLSDLSRRQHLHLVGKTGTGKSSLLYNLIRSDIERGRGFALLDPHGDLALSIADAIPPSRTNDTIYFDPLDTHVVSYNPLFAVEPLHRGTVAAHVVSSFKHIWLNAWGPRLEYILTNAIRVLLESDSNRLHGNRGTTTGTQVAGSPNAGGQTGDGNNRACANQAGRRRALT